MPDHGRWGLTLLQNTARNWTHETPSSHPTRMQFLFIANPERNTSMERLTGTWENIKVEECVFWDVKTCGCCKNRRFGGTYRLRHEGDMNQ
jgi:hypothetical protein